MINYKALLIKYIKFIQEENGIDYIDRATEYNHDTGMDEYNQGFSEPEVRELEELAKE